ncbi:MAG TPA: sulfite exporter TauE/SafE family protein [Brevundimonas sp.]|jgi:hypothetical protein
MSGAALKNDCLLFPSENVATVADCSGVAAVRDVVQRSCSRRGPSSHRRRSYCVLATVTLAAGPRANILLKSVGLRFGGRSIYFAQFLLGIYGGYFGGAVGLMMLAVWSLATSADLRQLTPLRTVMVAAANGAAVLCFAATGLVSWAETSIVMIGGILGGYVGARLSRRLPANVLRGATLSISVVTTAVFFARAY